MSSYVKPIALTLALSAAYLAGTAAPHAHAFTDQQARELLAELRNVRNELSQLRRAVENGGRR